MIPIQDIDRYRLILRLAALLLVVCIIAVSVAIRTPDVIKKRRFSCGNIFLTSEGTYRIYSYSCDLDSLPSWSRYATWICQPEAITLHGEQPAPNRLQGAALYVVRWLIARVYPLETQNDGLIIDRRLCDLEYTRWYG